MFTVLKVARLIDGTGAEPIEKAVLAIEDDKISAVGREEEIETPVGAQIIDLGDRTLLPGFTDSHMHFIEANGNSMVEWLLTPIPLVAIRAAVDAKRLLEAGFTAVRCMGSVVDIALRDAVNEGTVPGPRILAAGRAITQTRGHGDIHMVPMEWIDERWIGIVADGPDGCRKAARSVLRDGADVLKICTTGGGMSEKDDLTEAQFTVEEISAITEEAHRVNRKVGSHACSPLGVQNAIRGGVDTIEHGFYLDEETVQMMVDTNTPLVSSLVVGQRAIEHGAEHGIPEYTQRKNMPGMKPRYDSIKLAYEAGVKIALGSDLWGSKLMPHGWLNACEFELLVKAGMTPMDAIVAGTKHGAEVMGLEEEIGTLEVGKLADVVAVDGNPLEDITELQRVTFVMKRGEVVVG